MEDEGDKVPLSTLVKILMWFSINKEKTQTPNFPKLPLFILNQDKRRSYRFLHNSFYPTSNYYRIGYLM